MLEADFIVAAAQRYCDFEVRRLLEPGCGGGRLVVELARRGFQVTGWDLSGPAVSFAQQRLAEAGLTADVRQADMRIEKLQPPADVAYCLVNTFRHLLTETEARDHLRNIAASLRPGGLYIIGLHLLPPDADEEDDEEWTVSENDITVKIRLDVTGCSRISRQETLRFCMTVKDPAQENTQQLVTSYPMRIYQADQITQLFRSVPEFQLLDVYDFWYDIEEPQPLSDELGDAVFVLQKRLTT